MKYLVWSTLLVAAILTTSCSGVWMNPTYSELLDKTVINSEVAAQKARDGKLTEEEKTQILEKQAQTWKKFQNARDGKK
jgi:hypothetical protein